MEYVKVESSQIDSVGFGEGQFGPETLGIRFKNKSGITEYHYQNVTPRTYQALVAAESVGKYFGANIKNNAAYPWVKVEPDPTQPIQSVTATTKTETTNPSTASDVDTTDTPSPSTSLAIIDKLDNSALFASGGVTDAQLAAGREWYLSEAKKYDISTEAKRTELKRFARPLQKLRTGIEARAKEFTGETKRKIEAIDKEKRRLVRIVGDIEDAVLAPLTAWEQEEQARTTRLANLVTGLAEKGQPYSYPDIPSLETAIAELESFDLSTMQEYKVGGESAIAASLRVLRPELERRKVAESERVELERLRAESAARAEKDRIAEEKRKEDARIAEAVEAAKVEIRQEVIAELSVPTKPDWMEPTSEETEVVPFVYEQAPPSAPVVPFIDHKQAIHAEIVEALQGCTLTRQEAISVLKAITEGRIPHVSITY